MNLLIGFLIGIMLGSLVDCLANRSLTKESFWGRSYCDFCKRKLAWYDLFPIFSFIFQRGKCRYCHKDLPLEYLQVEILTGLLIALLFYLQLPSNFFSLPTLNLLIIASDLIFKSFIVCILLIVFLTDLKTGLIPDRITYPSIVIALVLLILNIGVKIYATYLSLNSSPLGKYLLPPHSDYFLRHALDLAQPLGSGLIAALILGAFFLILIVVTRGRGMGGGDLKLSIFLGLCFGIYDSLVLLMVAFLTGSIVGILLILFGKKKIKQTIPFGPFLSLGALITLFWGDKLLNWYLKLNLN